MRPVSNQADLETTNRLRRAVAQSARLPAAITVEAAVNAVMCAVTTRLTPGAAHELLRGLPAAVRPMFAACVLHREQKPTAKLDRSELVASVADHLAVTPAHAELVCSAVFNAVRAELDGDTVHAVAAQLPRSIADLWFGGPVTAPDLDVAVPPQGIRRAVETDLERRAHLPPDVPPGAAFSAVMCALARRLSGGEAKHVLLGLPPDLRPLVEPCALHRSEEAEVFGRDTFFGLVEGHLGTSPEDTGPIVREVFRAAKRSLPQRTIAEIEAQLPPDLAELWREALPPR